MDINSFKNSKEVIREAVTNTKAFIDSQIKEVSTDS